MEIAGYILESQIGAGASAVVYRARQVAVDAYVALKVLREGLSEQDRRRVDAERRAMGRLRGHPHIVTVFDAGVTDGGRDWIAAELMLGGSLEDRLRRGGRATASEVASTGAAVASALAAAHAEDLVHRDVKPANILLDAANVPKLGDFGIVSDSAASKYTSSAMTVAYAAPELFEGSRPTPACDVYALALTLYEMASGRHPFMTDRHDSVVAVIARIVDGGVNPLVDVPQRLGECIAAGLARDPDERPSAGEMAAMLREVWQPLADSPLLIPGVELGDMLGEGTFGRVYQATQVAANRPVAVKVLHSAIEDAEAATLFGRRCEVLVELGERDGIVGVLDAGLTAGNFPYLVMPLFEGGSLQDRMTSGPLPVADVLLITRRLAEAIAAAHEVGVLHLNLKPANVLFDRQGSAHVADFGIGRLMEGLGLSTSSARASPDHTPPEISDGTSSAATDVHGLGLLVHVMAFGGPPGQVSTERSDLPAWVPVIVQGCLNADPRARPAIPTIAAYAATGQQLPVDVTQDVAHDPHLRPGHGHDADTPQAPDSHPDHVEPDTTLLVRPEAHDGRGQSVAPPAATQPLPDSERSEGAVAASVTRFWPVLLGLAILAAGSLVFRSTRPDSSEATATAPTVSMQPVPATITTPDDPVSLLGTSERIAFVSDRGGDLNIHSARPDGTAEVQLTADPGMDFQPAWSPDGRSIVFTSDRQGGTNNLHVVNADGSTVRRLTNGPGEYDPSWSPDGNTIVYSGVNGETGGRDLYVVDVVTGAIENVPSTTGEDLRPVYVPMDEDRIVFVSDVVDGNLDLFDVRRSVGVPQRSIGSTDESEHHPAFSPDGELMVFQRGEFVSQPSDDAETTVVVLDSDGDEVRLPSAVEGLRLRNPDFAPSGNAITAEQRLADGGSRIIAFPIGTSDADIVEWGPGGTDPAWFRPAAADATS